MTLFEFVAKNPVFTVAVIAGTGTIFYASFLFFKKNLSGISTLLSLSSIVFFYSYSQAYNGALRQSKTETIVVMPNKQNLRLGEDGNLSFCLNGMARNWQKTTEGIISSSPRYYLGRPMRCLSVEEGIKLLVANGASKEEVAAVREAYRIN